MDIEKVLAKLRENRQQIDEAIVALERLAGGQQRRRGRPPKWLADIQSQNPNRPARGSNSVSLWSFLMGSAHHTVESCALGRTLTLDTCFESTSRNISF